MNSISSRIPIFAADLQFGATQYKKILSVQNFRADGSFRPLERYTSSKEDEMPRKWELRNRFRRSNVSKS